MNSNKARYIGIPDSKHSSAENADSKLYNAVVEENGYLRVVDDTGKEDLYNARLFVAVDNDDGSEYDQSAVIIPPGAIVMGPDGVTDKSATDMREVVSCISTTQELVDAFVPGEGVTSSSEQIPTYSFLKEKYSNIVELVNAMAINWNEGKKQLFRGLLSGFFKSVDPEIAGYCIDAEEAHANGGNADVLFFQTIYGGKGSLLYKLLLLSFYATVLSSLFLLGFPAKHIFTLIF